MAVDGETKLESPADRSDGIGRKLRQRRMIKGRSLQQVAEQAEISVGLLSQIERGLTMPSLRSLRQICTALDMPVGWLFDVPTTEHDDVVVRASGLRTLDLGPKGLRKELMSPDAVSGIQMMRMTISPMQLTTNNILCADQWMQDLKRRERRIAWLNTMALLKQVVTAFSSEFAAVNQCPKRQNAT